MSEENLNKIHSIVITGTKGKTTITNMVSYVLRHSAKDVVSVDTLGSYFNLEKQSDYKDSLKIFGKSPNVMPGRYIYWYLRDYNKPIQNLFAVLETSFGSAKLGTGIPPHEVGIFTNIFRDHIDNDLIKSEDDIYLKKSFVFNSLKEGGDFIANLDNAYTQKSLKEPILIEKNINTYGVTVNLNKEEELRSLADSLNLKDIFFFYNDKAYSLNKGEMYNFSKFRYFMKGFNKPMIENALYTFASCLKYVSVDEIAAGLNTYLLPEEYGRFLGYKKDNNIVIVDYAHEENSLKLLIDSVRNSYNKNPYVITRIAPDRVNGFIEEYAKALSSFNNISGLTIYDKIDGVGRSVYNGRKLTRNIGESSKLMINALEENNPSYPVKRILNDVEALKDAIVHMREELIIFIFSEMDAIKTYLNEEGYKRFL